jgi:hypothetical protein
MEINTSNDSEHDINSSRIRSLRRRKRAQHDAFDKALLKLYREYKAINVGIHSLGWEELKPPVQSGWMRTFILRYDVRRSKQSIFYQQILDKINTTEYSWRKDFKKKQRQSGRKVYVVREQTLRRLDEREFFSKKFTDPERSCFHETLTHPAWSKIPVKVYVFMEAWRFALKISPRMVTKVRILDVVLKRRESELSNYIDHHNLWPKINKLLHGDRHRYHFHQEHRSPFTNKSFHNILAEHWPATEATLNPRINPGVSFFCGLFLSNTFTNFENHLHTMQGTYRIAKGWRIFIYTFAPVIIVVFLSSIFIVFTIEDMNPFIAPLLAIGSLVMTCLFAYGLIDTIQSRLIIGNDHITSINPLGARTLKFEDILGYKIERNGIFIMPKIPTDKKIKTSTYIEKADQITAWLSSKFTDLNKQELAEQENHILKDDGLGLSLQAREYRLAEARRIARITNATGFVLFLWITFYPVFYTVVLIIGIIYPLIIIILLYLYRGLLRVDERKNNAYPSVSTGFIMAGLSLSLRALFDYNILEYKQLWITTGTLAVLLIILILIATKLPKFKSVQDYFMIFTLMILTYSYSFGAYTISNCLFDKSAPKYYRTNIVQKEISKDRSTTYYIIVTSWHNTEKIEKVTVSSEDYDRTSIGDEIAIAEMKGLFGTPWYLPIVQE